MKIKENKSLYRLKKIFWMIVPLIISYFAYSFIQDYNLNKNGSNNKINELSSLMKETKNDKSIGRRIQVMILNGCGEKGIARLYANFLRNKGYDVIDYDNAKSFDHGNTKIRIHSRDSESFEYKIIELLKIKPDKIEYNNSKNIFYDMTIIIGDDFKLLDSYKEVSRHYELF